LRARGTCDRASLPRTFSGAADACALSLRTSGRGPRGVPADPGDPARRARARARRRAAGARARDPRAGSGSDGDRPECAQTREGSRDLPVQRARPLRSRGRRAVLRPRAARRRARRAAPRDLSPRDRRRVGERQVGPPPGGAGAGARPGGAGRPPRRTTARRAVGRARARTETELVDALVDDVAGEAGALPLLSTAMVDLWREHEEGLLALAVYERTGG